MLLSGKQLIGLPVKTKDGRYLGRIKDFELETANGQIAKYIVSSSDLVKKILAQDLIIDKSQVLEINNQVMTVASGLVGDKALVSDPIST
ncbi:PRC-barrel domain-containing protein [Candidatus Falkowbacteria bacterium]|nr:PRC-barrel domain-containing protein [Candidatus Falkowbacteria bacterium]